MSLIKISDSWSEVDSEELVDDKDYAILQVQSVYEKGVWGGYGYGFAGTTFQNPSTMMWEFIPVGKEVWYSVEEGELVAITK